MTPAESTTRLARRALDHSHIVCADETEARTVADALAAVGISTTLRPSALGDDLWAVSTTRVSVVGAARARAGLEGAHVDPAPAAGQIEMFHVQQGAPPPCPASP